MVLDEVDSGDLTQVPWFLSLQKEGLQISFSILLKGQNLLAEVTWEVKDLLPMDVPLN